MGLCSTWVLKCNVRDKNFLRSGISHLRCTNLIHWTGIRADTDPVKLIRCGPDMTDPCEIQLVCQCHKIHCVCFMLDLNHSRVQTQ